MRVVRIEQNMDRLHIGALLPVLDEMAASQSDICLDLLKVDHIDSSGIGAIGFVCKRLRRHKRRVVLVNVTGQPLQLLRRHRLEFLLGEPPRTRAKKTPLLRLIRMKLKAKATSSIPAI